MQCEPTYTGLFQYEGASAQANPTQRDVKMHSVIELPIVLRVKTMHLGNQGLVGPCVCVVLGSAENAAELLSLQPHI